MRIESVSSAALDRDTRRQVLTLCHTAYEEDLTHYLADIGPGVHLLGWFNDALVSHVAIVPRSLEVEGLPMLHTAYVELVATDPPMQRRGFASALLQRAVAESSSYDIAALSPSDDRFYARLGWEKWRGPLRVRTDAGTIDTPEEEIMIHRLPRTPHELDVERAVSVEWRRGEIW